MSKFVEKRKNKENEKGHIILKYNNLYLMISFY